MKKVLSLALLTAIIATMALTVGVGAQSDPGAVVAAFEKAFNDGNVAAALDTFAAEPVVRTPADVYPSRGLVESWLNARILVDKVKYNLEGQRTVSGNKVNWEIKPSTGSNLLAEAEVEGGKIKSLTLRNKPAATPAPTGAAGAAGAAGTPAAGAAAGAAQTTPAATTGAAAGAAQTTPAATTGATTGAAGAAQTTPAATTGATGAAQTTPSTAANVAQATPAATPSALPSTGQGGVSSMMWLVLAGLLLAGLGVTLLRKSMA